MKFSIALGYFVLFSAVLHLIKPIGSKYILCGFAALLVISGFAIFNDFTGIIDEKFASFVSYDMFHGASTIPAFYLQYLLTYIPHLLFDYAYTAHGFNIGLQAFSFMLVIKYVFRGNKNWLLYVFLIYPSYYHYSIFGLRDTLISFVTILIVLSVLYLDQKKFYFICILLAFVCSMIRPELSVMILGFGCITLYMRAKSKYRPVIVLFAFAGLYLSLLVMPLAFGIQGTGSALGNIELLSDFNLSRGTRNLDAYIGGSHLLGGKIYNYNFLIRYPIQIAASIVTPLPFEIRGTLDYLAFAESMLFCSAVFVAWRGSKHNRIAKTLFLFGIAYILLQALFAANYGNILRVRYPGLIFFVGSIAATYNYPPPRRKQKLGANRR